MLDGVTGELLRQLGAAGLAGLAVLSVLIGWLIPLRSHQRELDAANKRGDEWQQAWATERARADLLASQMAEILTAVPAATREPS
jgi:hypothetical protein